VTEALLTLSVNLVIIFACIWALLYLYFPRIGRPIEWVADTVDIVQRKRSSVLDSIKKSQPIRVVARPKAPKILSRNCVVDLLINVTEETESISILPTHKDTRVFKSVVGVTPDNLIDSDGRTEVKINPNNERFTVDSFEGDCKWQIIVENAYTGIRTGFHTYDFMGCVSLTKGVWQIAVIPENGQVIAGETQEVVALTKDHEELDDFPTIEASIGFHNAAAAKEIWAILISGVFGVTLQGCVDASVKLVQILLK
jgi:hypothetical protein